MEIAEVTMFVAADGTRHDSRLQATLRNLDLARDAVANAALEAGHSVHSALILSEHTLNPPDALAYVNKDTPLIISHWQCRDEPGYRVTRFDRKGIYVYGHAGSWSGPYGNYVPVADLAHYAEKTRAASAIEARQGEDAPAASCGARERDPKGDAHD